MLLLLLTLLPPQCLLLRCKHGSNQYLHQPAPAQVQDGTHPRARVHCYLSICIKAMCNTTSTLLDWGVLMLVDSVHVFASAQKPYTALLSSRTRLLPPSWPHIAFMHAPSSRLVPNHSRWREQRHLHATTSTTVYTNSTDLPRPQDVRTYPIFPPGYQFAIARPFCTRPDRPFAQMVVMLWTFLTSGFMVQGGCLPGMCGLGVFKFLNLQPT